jgi:hypothetical protein
MPTGIKFRYIQFNPAATTVPAGFYFLFGKRFAELIKKIVFLPPIKILLR